jgi:hypothetical protein
MVAIRGNAYFVIWLYCLRETAPILCVGGRQFGVVRGSIPGGLDTAQMNIVQKNGWKLNDVQLW